MHGRPRADPVRGPAKYAHFEHYAALDKQHPGQNCRIRDKPKQNNGLWQSIQLALSIEFQAVRQGIQGQPPKSLPI
jgi:hypothetical protein